MLLSTIVLLAIFAGFLMADEQERFFMKVGTGN